MDMDLNRAADSAAELADFTWAALVAAASSQL